MFRRVLVAYLGSEGAREALEVAVGLAEMSGGDLVGLAIEAHLPRYAGTIGEVEEAHRLGLQECQRWLKEAGAYADEQGVALRPDVRTGHPAPGGAWYRLGWLGHYACSHGIVARAQMTARASANAWPRQACRPGPGAQRWGHGDGTPRIPARTGLMAPG